MAYVKNQDGTITESSQSTITENDLKEKKRTYKDIINASKQAIANEQARVAQYQALVDEIDLILNA